MALSYKFIKRPEDVEKAGKLLTEQIMPLLAEYWEKRGKSFFHAEQVFRVDTFVNLWMVNGLVLIMAYDSEIPVGVFIGLKMTPMMFNRQVMQVETCYGKTPEAEQGLYDFLDSIMGILGIDELWVFTDTNPEPRNSNWRKLTAAPVVRYGV